MNFGIAKIFSAVDKVFQDKYNYLIDLLSSKISSIDTEKTTIEFVRETLYPIGTIVTLGVATNPATLYGFGTWTQIKDMMILGVGDTYALNATGGAATHTLTVGEMPSHGHSVSSGAGQELTTSISTVTGKAGVNPNTGSNTYTTFKANDNGGGVAHNNMPPYKAKYIWERTA